MKRILIIEDEQKIAELERDYLEMEGFEVVIAGDGNTGLSLALNEAFDLLILDLMLPGIDGFNICREIRQHKDLSIIMVTAKGENIDTIRGLGLGADDYMTKPFNPQELVARVKSHIRRYDLLTSKRSQQMSEINIGYLRIEIDARRVYVNDKEVVFTTKEFDTLLLLAENPNIVFEKGTIFERIWGLDSIGDLATVAVHIRRIREKIEVDPANPEYIETVWGAGYRFKKSNS
ncbi:MAG: response regulator transcription factor [Clostridia bacterium]|nr:response regulator transcription factor [Clostridia bacterium]